VQNGGHGINEYTPPPPPSRCSVVYYTHPIGRKCFVGESFLPILCSEGDKCFNTLIFKLNRNFYILEVEFVERIHRMTIKSLYSYTKIMQNVNTKE
jgi:hypothetical protein